MSRRRPRSRREKRKRKRNLTPIQRNEIVVLREMGFKFREIAEKTQLGYSTCYDVYHKAANDAAVIRKARGEALIRAARETESVAKRALDAITPDSLRTDRIEVHDDAGNLVDVRHRGPSPLQLATTYGILVDKATKLEDRGEILMEGGRPALTPDAMLGLLSKLGERIGKLKGFGIEVDLVEGRLSRLSEEVEADYTVVSEGDESNEEDRSGCDGTDHASGGC